jgi:TPR repeat protein
LLAFSCMNAPNGRAQTAPAGVSTFASTQEAIRRGREAFAQKDYASALTWFGPAADQGNAEAQNYIGWMYENGEGAREDDGVAVGWFRKSADRGNAIGEVRLARMYFMGRGVAQNYSLAALWCRKAAEQGDADAQGFLGSFYLNGLGVAQDYVQATKWLRLAADQGNEEAQFGLGVMYAGGMRVTRSYPQAEIWFRKAAAQGHAKAKLRLADLAKENQQQNAACFKNAIPAALQFRCVLEGGGTAARGGGDAKEVERRYNDCLRSNWSRLFGSRPFPCD